MEEEKRAIIIGGGPAGLTAAYELLKTTGVHPVVLEENDAVGGISRTLCYHGNRIDIGGHRFFSKSDRVMQWWKNILPLQGAPASDDRILNREKPLEQGGPDPEKEDRVMLVRSRVSRILYLRKFFDYPISLKPETFRNMGLSRTCRAGFGYLGSRLKKRQEITLEDFMINRFGRPLYEMFFEKYTAKVWGRHPSEISASWGAQRIRGLSLTRAVLEALKKPFENHRDIAQKEADTSLIRQFLYPKYGPGQLWETVAGDVRKMGGEIFLHTRVTGVECDGGKITAVIAEQDGVSTRIEGDYFISSMPVKDLVADMEKSMVPHRIQKAASGLPYRDFITVGLLANRLKLKNTTKIPTVGNIVPDTWIYIQEDDVKIGRLQIFNNWSPYLVNDPEKIWVGLEYFCNEGDELWNMEDRAFINFAKGELSKIGVLDPKDVLDGVRFKIKKAYPAYFGTYEQFPEVRQFLGRFENLFCVGRNGQHRYNNMDHSMLTAFAAVDCIRIGSTDKTAVWNVNTEEEYHEEKR